MYLEIIFLVSILIISVYFTIDYVFQSVMGRGCYIFETYIEELNKGIITRKIPELVDESKLIWHRDVEDREILIKSGEDWKLQLDNQLPIKLIKGESYRIPKMVYHRVIKGQDDLLVEIKKD